MKDTQITEMMQHISPRYTEEAAARAAKAKPKPSFLPAIGVLAGVTMCAAIAASMIYVANQQKLRENTASTAEESADAPAESTTRGYAAAQNSGTDPAQTDGSTAVLTDATDAADVTVPVVTEGADQTEPTVTTRTETTDKSGTTTLTTSQTTALQTEDTTPQKDIYTQLRELDYSPVVCDGLPEYELNAPDGTVFLLNFSSKWVWIVGTEAEAKLPDALITWLNANSGQLPLSICEWNHSTFDQPQIDWFCDGKYLREGIFSDVRADRSAIITSVEELRAYLTPLYQDATVQKYLAQYNSSFFAEHNLLVNTVCQGSGMQPMLCVQDTAYNPDRQTFRVNLDWMYEYGAAYESVESVDFVRIAVSKTDPITSAVWEFVDK